MEMVLIYGIKCCFTLSKSFRQLLQEAKLELKKSKRKDFYKILGVEKTANDDEIKKAYRKRAMVHHPDRHSSASEEEKKDHETKFKEVTKKSLQLLIHLYTQNYFIRELNNCL